MCLRARRNLMPSTLPTGCLHTAPPTSASSGKMSACRASGWRREDACAFFYRRRSQCRGGRGGLWLSQRQPSSLGSDCAPGPSALELPGCLHQRLREKQRLPLLAAARCPAVGQHSLCAHPWLARLPMRPGTTTTQPPQVAACLSVHRPPGRSDQATVFQAPHTHAHTQTHMRVCHSHHRGVCSSQEAEFHVSF